MFSQSSGPSGPSSASVQHILLAPPDFAGSSGPEKDLEVQPVSNCANEVKAQPSENATVAPRNFDGLALEYSFANDYDTSAHISPRLNHVVKAMPLESFIKQSSEVGLAGMERYLATEHDSDSARVFRG